MVRKQTDQTKWSTLHKNNPLQSLVATLLAITIVQFCWSISVQAQEQYITGIASVIDADTLIIHGNRIRLHGIDAPEASQTCQHNGKHWRCGQKAALALSDRLNNRTITCIANGEDRYKRIVTECSQGNTNINAWLVEKGWALDWPKYSKGAYATQQKAAKASRLGIWDSTFELPLEWRSRKKK
ncbi:MAG: thermonuclease family protein [Candidatus Thiodiazotropha endolucinida]|nr:thermonuclease family protein [Candidatus Thiodiazotropha taylori]MCW4269849.1 thermonuclease family protein [Candidatus Thiodiazotropha endolucinida]